MESETSLTSTAGEGLYEILLHAARVSGEATKGAVGLLELELQAERRTPAVGVEVEFAYQDGRRVIDELAVRVQRDVEDNWDDAAMLRDGLRKFGGTDFTNIDVLSADGTDALDASVSFGSFLPVLAENIALPLGWQSADDLAFYSSLLADLGVSHHVSGGALRVSRKQLRTKMTVDQQVNAFVHARSRERTVSLYTCTLPAKQAVRFSESMAHDGKPRRVDVVLSRGLSGGRVCSSEDARQMQGFAERHLSVIFSGGVWSVRNVFGQGPARDREPVFGGRNRKTRLGRWRR